MSTDGQAAAHFVYIVRCADGTLYTGYARNPDRREAVHNRGRGAKYTAGRLPVKLVYSEAFASRGEALRRELEVKRWPRSRKERLVGTIRHRKWTRGEPEAGEKPEKTCKIDAGDWQSCCE